MPPHRYRIEPLRPPHLAEVVALEEQAGLSSRGIEGYSLALNDPQFFCLVVTTLFPPHQVDQLVGLFSASLVLDELQIDTLAIDPGWREQGIASHLLERALAQARQRGARRALLEVRPSNLAARALYHKAGFLLDGRRPAYYRSPLEDALLLSRFL
jgi:ribosomal protein S18 acetylase RimI-like enzyme